MRATIFSLFSGLLIAVATLVSAAPAQADVDDFSYESWDTRVVLEKNADGHAVAHITETLVVNFPETDQNKGIIRGLPEQLHGANSSPEDVTVTDAGGSPTPFFTERSDGFFVILTGDDEYVHGRTTYVISYDIPDPIFRPDNANIDEFSFDMVSVDRKQHIDAFSASVTVGASLLPQLNGDVTVYVGEPGSKDQLPVRAADGTIGIDPLALGANETVTFAIGFEPDTVTQPNARLQNQAINAAPLVMSSAALALVLASSITFVRFRKRHRETGRAVIAQYEAPETLPPLLAAAILHPATLAPIAPQILHLAVRGNLRIEEQLKANGEVYRTPRMTVRNLFPGRPSHEVTRDALDASTLDALFTKKHPEVRAIPKSSQSFAQRMAALTTEGVTASNDRGYFTRAADPTTRVLSGVALFVSLIAAVLLALAFATDFARGMSIAAIPLTILAFVWSFIGLAKRRVHTPAGAEAYEYLEGLRLFIQVAESERIKMLQSYTGAEREALDDVAIVQLYERLLPYAVLFGLEKEWSSVLATRYEAAQVTTPYWYPLLASRGLAELSSSVHSFAGSITSAASYTASTSSGSSGGGFAGGGGGGGFSGGR